MRARAVVKSRLWRRSPASPPRSQGSELPLRNLGEDDNSVNTRKFRALETGRSEGFGGRPQVMAYREALISLCVPVKWRKFASRQSCEPRKYKLSLKTVRLLSALARIFYLRQIMLKD